jgi:hypothetical protein
VGWRDRIIGIVLGVVVGVGVIIAFVFFLSEQTVDAPSLSGTRPAAGAQRGGGGSTHQGHQGPGQPQQPTAPSIATVRIIDGGPPASGPVELQYKTGDEIRLSVLSNASLDVDLTGYGLTRTIPADEPTEIDVRAKRAGTFALIVADSHIDVARISVSG